MVGLFYRHRGEAGFLALGDGQFHRLGGRHVAEGVVGVDERGDRRFAQDADIRFDVDLSRGELLRIQLHHGGAMRVDAADVGRAHALGADAGMLGAHAPGGEYRGDLRLEGVEGDAHGSGFQSEFKRFKL